MYTGKLKGYIPEKAFDSRLKALASMVNGKTQEIEQAKKDNKRESYIDLLETELEKLSFAYSILEECGRFDMEYQKKEVAK